MSGESTLARKFVETHPTDAVGLFEGIDPEAGAAILEDCSPRAAAHILQRLAPTFAAAIAFRLSAARLHSVLPELSAEATLRLLRSLEPANRDRLLAELSPKIRRSLRVSLEFPESTVGAWMDPFALVVPAEITAKEARTRVRRGSKKARYYLYVVDQKHVPQGVISLRELLAAAPDATIASIMQTPVIKIPSNAPTHQVAVHPAFDELRTLPVVDTDGVLLGVVRLESLEQALGGAVGARRGRQESLGLEVVALYCSFVANLIDGLATITTGATGPSDTREDRHGS